MARDRFDRVVLKHVENEGDCHNKIDLDEIDNEVN